MGHFLEIEHAAGTTPGDSTETTRVEFTNTEPENLGDIGITFVEEITDVGVRDFSLESKPAESINGNTVMFLLMRVEISVNHNGTPVG